MQRTKDPADRVYGVLFRIAECESDDLDRAEGVGTGYVRGEVQVTGPEGTRAAVTYIADNIDPDLRPYHWYKEFVVRGALEHKFPAAYIRRLQTTDSRPDRNRDRCARNKALFVKE